ncbi:hypothetical protein QU487_02670 [Crenobacter sp. SG2305]|uniref:hypothetical protein n=1 Tax=Crenobacter oryzisoli TaxID=3056844 RepID=UPI0025AB4F34|nr:hypothetical protein [Crenobacter sp. SG2305]MDN0081665.1 hypothetical protein [Crenobacter sp. SG2305]
MKFGYLIVVALLAGCTALPTVFHSSSSYPRLSADESQRIATTLDHSRQAGKMSDGDYRASMRLLADVQGGKPLSENQVSQLSRLKSLAAKQREDERRAQEQRRQQLVEKKRQQDDEAAKKAQYQADFDAIQTPEDGTAFIKKYQGSFDPDNLTSQALKRGFDREIQQKKECIDHDGQVIAKQQKLIATGGSADKSALYYAKANQLVCKKRLMQLLTTCAKDKICR